MLPAEIPVVNTALPDVNATACTLVAWTLPEETLVLARRDPVVKPELRVNVLAFIVPAETFV